MTTSRDHNWNCAVGGMRRLAGNIASIKRKNFEDGWENDGAALTVFYKGKKVVDAWGGYADRQAARKWHKDTLTVTFSTTKAVAALCIAILVDRGDLKYEDLVTKYWPGFAKHGKGNVTVQMALSDMAGLAYVDQPITEQIAADHAAMKRLLEEERPKWPPGTQTGYHLYTYGWIVDQLIRAADKRNRGIGQFFSEEIAQKLDVDYFIGLPKQLQYRVSRLNLPPFAQALGELRTDPTVLKYVARLAMIFRDTMLSKAVNNPDWLHAIFKLTFNNPDYHRLQLASALGIGNARSLAKMFSMIPSGQMFGGKVLQSIKKPYLNQTDIMFHDRISKGNGFIYFDINRAGAKYGIGQSGHGCQQVIFDPFNDVTIAYVTNALKLGLYMQCRTYARIQSSVYDVLEGIKQH